MDKFTVYSWSTLKQPITLPKSHSGRSGLEDCFLLDQWIKLWHLRNIQRHGADMQRQNQIRGQQALHSKLRKLHTYRHRVCPADLVVLFHPSADHHLTLHSSLDAIETWIATNKEAIKASASQAQRLGITRNRTLDKYPAFNPILQDNQQASQTADVPVL